MRHKYLQYYCLSSCNYFRSVFNGKKYEEKTLIDYPCSKLEIDSVILYKWIDYYCVKYIINDGIVLDRHTPEFGKIRAAFVIEREENPCYFLIVSRLTVKSYCNYLTNFMVKDDEKEIEFVDMSKLTYISPLDIYSIDDKYNVIIPKNPFF